MARYFLSRSASFVLAFLSRVFAKSFRPASDISDNESWVDAGAGRGTATLAEWNLFKKRNPEARMVCIDIQPGKTTQAKESSDIMNIGGFSDAVFTTITEFAAGRLGSDRWVGEIEAIEI